MSSAMPVVWCTGPNSSDKPTAFALHGIQLQGNISDEHVLAVRELIAAASEGRLILPSDGTVMLLDCGVGVGSVVVGNGDAKKRDSDGEQKPAVLVELGCGKRLENTMKEIKADVHMPPPQPPKIVDTEECTKENVPKKLDTIIDSEQLYEFLCCAKCMNDGVSRCFVNGTRRKSSIDNKKLIEKYLKTRRHSNDKARGIHKNSFKSRRATPLYTPVVPKQAIKKITVTKIDDTQKIDSIAEVTSRKTSLDSTITVSSHDSGFIEMQNNKQNLSQQTETNQQELKNCNIEIIVSDPTGEYMTIPEINPTHDINKETYNIENSSKSQQTYNFKDCLTQSRNRRKSYEEFKSMFRQNSNNERSGSSNVNSNNFSGSNNSNNVIITGNSSKKLEIVNEQSSLPSTTTTTTKVVAALSTEPIKSRRKSYEEFKALVKICDNDLNNDYKSVANSVYNNSIDDCEEAALDTSSSLIKRKNSKRMSTSRKDRLMGIFLNNKLEPSPDTDKKNVCEKIYDIVQKRPQKTENGNQNTSEKYKSNYKIYDKLISYGTIYDIIQKKAELYDQDLKNFEKYMTYGTIYEILRHKTNGSEEEYPRKRAFSERIYRQLRNNLFPDGLGRYTTIHESMSNHRLSNALTSPDDENNGTDVWNNTATLSTIYDILQTKSRKKSVSKNRFLVKKITEEDLEKDKKPNNTAVEEVLHPIVVEPQKKTRLRRFSNILSYKSSNHPSTTVPLKKKSVSLPITPDTTVTSRNELLDKQFHQKITNHFLSVPTINTTTTPSEQKLTDDLYSRINKLSLSATSTNNPNFLNKIYKCSSIDVLSCNNDDKSPNESELKIFLNNKNDRKISANAIITSDNTDIDGKTSINSTDGKQEKTRRLSEFTRGEFLNEKL